MNEILEIIKAESIAENQILDATKEQKALFHQAELQVSNYAKKSLLKINNEITKIETLKNDSLLSLTKDHDELMESIRKKVLIDSESKIDRCLSLLVKQVLGDD